MSSAASKYGVLVVIVAVDQLCSSHLPHPVLAYNIKRVQPLLVRLLNLVEMTLAFLLLMGYMVSL